MMNTKLQDLSCPMEGRILAYFQGVFESVYIVLSPFIEPKTIEISLFYPQTYPEKQQIIKNCNFRSWKEVCEISGIKNIQSIDIGLKSRIHALKQQYHNENLVKEIEKIEKWVPPTEGQFSPFVENSILSYLLKEGHRRIVVRDEHLSKVEELVTSELIEREMIPYAGSFCTLDNEIYATTHWDSHFSFICSSKKNLEKIVFELNLEGFFCDERTEVNWSLT